MKRLIVCLLCFVCTALLIIGCTRPPMDDPTMDVPKQTQPAEPAPTEPAVPSTEPTVPSTEPASRLPEGTPLTDGEIAWFNEHFFTDEWAEFHEADDSAFRVTANIHNQFLYQQFDSPQNIDLALLFFQGFSLSQFPSQAEKVAVHEMLGMEWDPEPGCSIDLFRVSREAMEAVFLENTGLTIAQTQQVGMDREDIYYLEAYDAYYHSHGDFAYDCFVVREGVRQEDGTVVLLYYRPRSETGAEGIVTLVPHEDSYWFVSNRHIG